MTKHVKLGTLAQVVRSKNAGPFRVTLDIFFETKKNYLLVKNSGVLKQSRIANLYRIPETDVLGFILRIMEEVGISPYWRTLHPVVRRHRCIWCPAARPIVVHTNSVLLMIFISTIQTDGPHVDPGT